MLQRAEINKEALLKSKTVDTEREITLKLWLLQCVSVKNTDFFFLTKA